MNNIEKKNTFRKVMSWIGIILTGLSGVVLFGGDKVTSGILLMVTMIIMILPIRQNKILRWARVVFICVVFCLVIWNIFTTEIPGDEGLYMILRETSSEQGKTYTTGFRFFDQLINIFKGFLEGRVFIKEP